MSHKGAIKKTSASKNVHHSSVRSRSKDSSSNQELQRLEKINSKGTRKMQTLEQMGDDDKHKPIMQNVLSSKSSAKESVRSFQSRSYKESIPSASRPHISSRTMRSTLSSKTISDHTKQSNSNNLIKGSRSTGRVQNSYSEKRGLSTMYVPQSLESKLISKSVSRKTSLASRSEEKEKSKANIFEESVSKTKSRVRKLSRTLSPSEIKMLRSSTTRSNSLQKTDQSGNTQQETEEIDAEYDYEDDFEDYESDFQECTDSEASEISEETSNNLSNIPLDPIELQTAKQSKTINSAEQQKEEEHMYDSGHYELTEARRRAARVESIVANEPRLSSLLELRQPINKSYSYDKQSENRSLPLSTDEGFEDSGSGDFTKSPPLSQISFIDFRKNRENRKIKKSKKVLSRGEKILEMIKLDVMEWSLLECSPIPYEEFIRSYGKLNAQQISIQTGEDSIEVETQTDEIMFANKWTQFPITCRTNLKTREDLHLFQMDQIGVGGNSDLEAMNVLTIPSFDILRLNDFINRAGRVMCSLLEERQSGGNVFKPGENIPFSDGVVKLSIDSVTFLAGRAVTIINYSNVSNKVLLTIHAPAEEEIETSSKQDYITDCCIGCVWNISEPLMPVKLFYSSCLITACCFHLTNYNVVFAGLQDGSVSLWDLKEDEMWHQKITDKANELDWIVRMPTYTTAANSDISIYDSQIVAIRILSKIEEKSLERRKNKFIPIQICCLNESGSLIIWSVLHSIGLSIEDVGMSYWGSVRLVESQKFYLQPANKKRKIKAATFIDMHVDCVDSNNLYIATNCSNVLHATCIDNKPNPAMYKTLDNSPSGNVTCIESCPFGYSYFLVGCDDGTIRLHSLNAEGPILQLKDEDNEYEIKSVRWSKSKPCTIFVLDNNSRIHVWDLNSSDIFPMCTVNMNKYDSVSGIELSCFKTERDISHQYLALGTESGNVEIHKLKADFYYSKKEDYLKELNTFMRYVAIL